MIVAGKLYADADRSANGRSTSPAAASPRHLRSDPRGPAAAVSRFDVHRDELPARGDPARVPGPDIEHGVRARPMTEMFNEGYQLRDG